MKELIKELTELRDTIQKFGLVDEVILIHQAIQALSQSEWVSVEDRLPDSIGSYLCFWENCYVGMLFFNSNKEWCEMWQQEKHNPTHWMPLPQPPQTK